MIQLFDAGMSLARFNFSHGTVKVSIQNKLNWFQSNAKLLRTYAEAKRLRPYKTCALMLDLTGREIRSSATKEKEGIPVKFGDKIMIRSDNMQIPSSSTCIQIDCHAALGLLREGDEIKFGENAEVFGECEQCDENQI